MPNKAAQPAQMDMTQDFPSRLAELADKMETVLSDHLPAPQGHQSVIMEALRYTACLLYTSPSPRDLSTSRMPSSA